MLRCLIWFFFLITWWQAWSYSSFIGFGYTSCATCHYNAHGSGQLNDYGRALFASEIAAKPFWNPNTSDENLAKRSSFTFQEPTPRFLRPSLKYRDLYLTRSPGGSNSYRRYAMQADLGAALHFDAEDKYVFVASAGYTRIPINADIKEGAWNYNLLSREHYFRLQLGENHFVSLGLFDITYGIRLVDHTAVNRSGIGLDQNSQVHGILYNYLSDTWTIGIHTFAGNQMRDEISRLSGASATAEYTLKEKMTVGASVLTGSTQTFKRTLVGFLSRSGIGKGSALQTEFGIQRLEPKFGDATTGSYGVLVGTLRLFRGLDFESQVEILKPSMQETSPEILKYSAGLIYFPFQRAELRLNAVDSRSLNPSEVEEDAWALQSQLHLSL
jgi:hypothetical protein